MSMINEELELKALYYKAIEDYRQSTDAAHEEGLYFLKEAALKGSAEAEKMLGILYMSGQYEPHPSRDMKLAIHYYENAAEKGDVEAMYWLGQCYEMGLGVDKDEETAASWKQKAVDGGFVPAKEEELPEEEEAPESAPSITVENVTVVPGQESAADEIPQTGAPSPQGPQQAPQAVPGTPAMPIPKPVPAKPVYDRNTLRQMQQAQTEELDRRISMKHKLLWGGVYFGIAMAAIWIIIMILFLCFMKLLTGEEHQLAGMIFWICSGVISLGIGAVACVLGLRAGSEIAEHTREYHRSAFYHGFLVEMDELEEKDTWMHRIYKAFERYYLPVSNRQKADMEKLSQYQGAMYPGWAFATRRDQAEPDFVIATTKAVYVIRALFVQGSLEGDIHKAEWVMKDESGVTPILNQIDDNDTNCRIIRAELQLTTPLEVEKIPFYNVLMITPETDTRGLHLGGKDDKVIICQGSVERLRSLISMNEERLMPHKVGLLPLAGVFDKIQEKEVERKFDPEA